MHRRSLADLFVAQIAKSIPSILKKRRGGEGNMDKLMETLRYVNNVITYLILEEAAKKRRPNNVKLPP